MDGPPVVDPGLETPLAPLPPPATAQDFPRGPGLLAPARAGIRHALSCWRPMLLVVGATFFLGLLVAIPFQVRMAERLDSHAHAPALAGDPDAFDRALGWDAGIHPGVWEDAVRLEDAALDVVAILAFWVATFSWFFGALVAGGFLGTAADGLGPPGISRFLAEGGRWFARMFRVGFVFAVVMLLVGRLVFEMWQGAVEDAEKDSVSQGSAWWGSRIREAVFVLLFLWFRAAADLARAELVLGRRRSAFLAFFRSVGRTARRPLRTLLPALVLGAPAFAALLALSFALDALETGGAITIAATFALLQLAVWIRWTSRAAVLAADLRILAPRVP